MNLNALKELEDCFGERNEAGLRLFKSGKHSAAKVRSLLNTELVEFISNEYDCSKITALTALFNGKFVRCAVCGKPITNNLKSISCSIKCGRQMSLKHLRETGKIESVREKCRDISTKWWAEMDSELKDWIIGRLHAGQKEFLESITAEERKTIFNGNPNGYYESLRDYYEKLPREDFLAMRREIGKGMRKFDGDREPYYLYMREVWRITENTYLQYEDILNPNNKQRGHTEYHLDHKYSIVQGFIDDISPEIIGSVHNLELLWYSDNLKKSADCSISKEALLNSFYGGV